MRILGFNPRSRDLKSMRVEQEIANLASAVLFPHEGFSFSNYEHFSQRRVISLSIATTAPP